MNHSKFSKNIPFFSSYKIFSSTYLVKRMKASVQLTNFQYLSNIWSFFGIILPIFHELFKLFLIIFIFTVYTVFQNISYSLSVHEIQKYIFIYLLSEEIFLLTHFYINKNGFALLIYYLSNSS